MYIYICMYIIYIYIYIYIYAFTVHTYILYMYIYECPGLLRGLGRALSCGRPWMLGSCALNWRATANAWSRRSMRPDRWSEHTPCNAWLDGHGCLQRPFVTGNASIIR